MSRPGSAGWIFATNIQYFYVGPTEKQVETHEIASEHKKTLFYCKGC